MTVNILDAASDDIYDGYCFYEKRQQGLGAYFYSAVKDEIASLNLSHNPSGRSDLNESST